MPDSPDGRGVPIWSNPTRVLQVTLAIIATLQFAGLASRVYLTLSRDVGMSAELIQLLDADREQSLPTWFTLVEFFTAAALCAVLAYRLRRDGSPHARGWVVAMGVLLAMSVDEQVGVHERTVLTMRHLLGVSDGPLYYAWVVPGMLVVVVVLLLMSRFATSLAPATRRRVAIATAVYLVGAIGVEMLYPGLYTTSFGDSVLAGVIAPAFPAIEETCEMTGIALVIWALVHELTAEVAREKVGAPS